MTVSDGGGGSSVVSIDSPQAWWSSVNLSTDRIIPHFQNLAEAVHSHGGKIMIQITHMGRRSRWDGHDWPTLVSPLGIREPVHRSTCKTIEVHLVESLTDCPSCFFRSDRQPWSPLH